MIYLAYDGSLNGDWVSRYAIRLAAHASERTLALLHVEDGSVSPAERDGKLEHIARECEGPGVEFFPQILPLQKNVLHTLLKVVPAGPDSLLVCGTRVRARKRALLAGTVSEQLLRLGLFRVLALRVVQPGLLGCPRDFLLPLAGHPRGFQSVWPFFRLFLPDVERLYLLRGMPAGPLGLRHLSEKRLMALRAAGDRYLQGVAEEVRHRRGTAEFRLDRGVVVCEDWVREILVHASRLRSRMLLLGASERTRAYRLLHGVGLERVLRGAPCDVGIYRGP